MKTALLTFGLIALGLNFADAGCSSKKKTYYAPKKTYVKKSTSYTKKSSYKPSSHKTKTYHRHHHHDPAPIHIGTEHLSPRDGFMKRLATAPGHSGYGYNHHGSTALVSLRNDSVAASRISLLGKVEYGWGKSELGYDSKAQIDRTILNARAAHSPNCVIVVFGFADKSGPADVNLRLSETRAEKVRSHIDHLNWSHGLHLKTATVPMGENVELCRDDFGHNRVAEIWMLEFPSHPAPNHIVKVVEQAPATTQVITQPQIIAPAATQVVTTAPAPAAPQSQIISQTTTPVATAPVQTQPNNQEALLSLVKFLEQNVAFTSEAQQAEFAQALSNLR